MTPKGPNMAWLAWVGAVCVLGLGWFAFNRGGLQPQRLESDVEARASVALAKAGFSWARLDVHDKVGELQGEAPTEDARSAAYDAARQLLAPYMGLPGVFSELDNRVRVKVAPQAPALQSIAAVVAAKQPTSVVSPEAAAPPPRDCLDALNASLRSAPIRFKPRSAELPTSARSAIRRLVQVAKRCDRWRLVVEGYGDPGLPDSGNRRLIQKRALAVAAALLVEGVPVSQLALQTEDGRLKTPGAEAASAASRSARRVEFHLVRSVDNSG